MMTQQTFNVQQNCLWGEDGHLCYTRQRKLNILVLRLLKALRNQLAPPIGSKCIQGFVNLNTTVILDLRTCGSTHNFSLPNNLSKSNSKIRAGQSFSTVNSQIQLSFSILQTKKIKLKNKFSGFQVFPKNFSSLLEFLITCHPFLPVIEIAKVSHVRGAFTEPKAYLRAPMPESMLHLSQH